MENRYVSIPLVKLQSMQQSVIAGRQNNLHSAPLLGQQNFPNRSQSFRFPMGFGFVPEQDETFLQGSVRLNKYLQPIQFAETFRQPREFKIALTIAPEKCSLPLAEILPFMTA